MLGGGLGSITGSSNQGAISNFTNGGLGNTLFKQGGGNNGQLATQATQAVNDIVKQLMDAGISVALGNVTGLSIGSDKSYVYGADGLKEKLAGGQEGVQATVTSILNKILPSASGGDDISSGILAKYQANGGLNAGNITQLAQEIQQAQQAKVDADKASADLKAQVDAFGPAITAALKKITDPAGAAYDDIISAQQARLATAQQLGLDVNQLTALNDAEISQYLKSLNSAQLRGLISANDIAGNVADQARAIADAADAVIALADAQKQAANDNVEMAQRVTTARATLVDSYNSEFQALQANVTKYQQLEDSLRGYLTQLGAATGGPGAQYGIAKGAFLSTSALAQGGQADALGRLQQVSEQFLSASKAASVSLDQYRHDRALVTGAVSGAADIAGSNVGSYDRLLLAAAAGGHPEAASVDRLQA